MVARPRSFGQRPASVVTTASVALIAVLAVAYVVARDTGGSPGPLLGVDGGGASQPLRPADAGAAWGMHTLGNPTDDPITLRSVRLVGADGLVLSADPYVWDDERLELGFGTFSATVTPVPPEWHDVTRHRVDGYVIAPHDVLGTDGGVGDEVVLTFDAGEVTQSADGIEVRYEWRGRSYSKIFMSSFVMCPPTDTSECR